MMTLEEMKKIREEKGYTYEMISERTGVPFSTVVKIFTGETKHPRISTLGALGNLFGEDAQEEERWRRILYRPKDGGAITVREETAAYLGNGEYTLHDLEKLDDGCRYELYNGELVRMESGSVTHQRISLDIAAQFMRYIDEKGGNCVVVPAPNLRLRTDSLRNLLIPDMAVVCDPDKLTEKRIEGAPDFVLEITSPGTRKRDYGMKMSEYLGLGVKEYWIVDLQKKVLVIYTDYVPQILFFRDITEPVPVELCSGELRIDFSRIIRISEGEK